MFARRDTRPHERRLPRGGLGLLCILALCIHAFWAVGLAYIIWAGQSLSQKNETLFEVFGLRISRQSSTPDVIAAAGELGRLDLVALTLTFLGVILAIGAFIGFAVVRHAAISEAAAEAGNVTRTELPKMIDYGQLATHLLKNERFISTVKAAIEAANASDDSITAETANDIAQAFGENGEQEL